MLEKCVSGDGAAGIGVNVVNVFVSVHPPSGEDEQEPVKPNAREKVAKIRETLHCGFESAFGNLGAAVGKRPWITILICCLFAGVACTVSGRHDAFGDLETFGCALCLSFDGYDIHRIAWKGGAWLLGSTLSVLKDCIVVVV